MGYNEIVPNLICRFAIDHSRDIIVIKCLQKSIVGLSIGLKLLHGDIRPCVFISVGCLKSLEISPQTWASLQREGRILTKTRTSRPWAHANFKRGMSNSVFHFKRGPEQLCISPQTQVWATPHFNFNACLLASCFDFNTIMRRLWAPRLHNSARFTSSARPVFLL